MDINTVGVVGAGVMGTGVAQNLAQTDHRVILVDLSDDILDASRAQIVRDIRFQALFDKTREVDSPGQALERITFTTEREALEEAEFVIENVPEKWSVKEELFTALDGICRTSVIFSSNTSAIPITRIASATNRPSKVIGMHFMNPVPMKRMVEMIRGYHTSDETIETSKALLAAMDKECIVVNDSPGFVSNRVLMLTINEAVFLLQDQVATAQEVDRIFKSCFEHKMGPLETADLIGLDTILLSLEVLHESFKDSKYRPCPLLRKMVDAGLYGRKSKEGFYQY